MSTPVLLVDDYTKPQFRCSDGAMVYLTPHQSTHLLGITRIQPFRAMAVGKLGGIGSFLIKQKG